MRDVITTFGALMVVGSLASYWQALRSNNERYLLLFALLLVVGFGTMIGADSVVGPASNIDAQSERTGA